MHYVYKITNRRTGSYYIGSRTHPHPELDTYMGSSKLLKRLFKIEGIDIFEKTVLQIFPTRKQANFYERKLIREGFQTNPKLLYNRRTPGKLEAEKYVGIRADLWTDYFDEICKEYRSGSSLRSLADKYGCDVVTIIGLLKSVNIKIRTVSEHYKVVDHWRKGSKSISEEFKKKIIDEYLNSTIPVYKLAKKYKTSEPTLRKMLRENNIKFREVGFTSKNRTHRHPAWTKLTEIKSDVERYSKHYVCKKYEVTWTTLQKMLKEEI